MSNFFENTGKGVIVALLTGLIVFLVPIFAVLEGWLIGWIVRWIFGQYIISGLNLLFNTTRFDVTQLPIICATLGVIGSFFKSYKVNNNK